MWSEFFRHHVFRIVIDVESFHKWNPATSSARKLTEGEIREGPRFELTIKDFGRPPRGKGFFELFTPLAGVIPRKNLRQTADAVQILGTFVVPLE